MAHSNAFECSKTLNKRQRTACKVHIANGANKRQEIVVDCIINRTSVKMIPNIIQDFSEKTGDNGDDFSKIQAEKFGTQGNHVSKPLSPAN